MHFSSLTVQKPISFRTRFQLCLTVVAGLLLPAIAPAQTFTPNWVQLSPATSPPAGASYAMAYDAAHGQIVLFGGISFNGFLSDTWVWDGATWTQKSPATSPPDRVYSSMAYDAAHGQIVLFGGRNDGGNFSDTWVWDGTNWTQKTPATSPSARFGSSMAYDAAHGQLIMFGGCNSVSFLSDTWVWDGSNWTQEAPATSPNGRDMATMTYDAAHGQIVLFGGAYSSEFLNDTWLWNGSNWTLQSPGTSPGARFVSAMAYDASIGQTVLFGGNVSGYVNDTWLWDGTNWTEDFPATSPPARGLAAMAYDAASGQMVLFGGDASSEFLNDTWTWGLSSFGPQAVNTTSAAQTLNFAIPNGTTVGSIAVLTQGATGLDFANATGSTCTAQTYSSDTNCTVNVTFKPQFPGMRMGAVVFFSGANNTGTILSTMFLSGTGTGPQVAFNPAPTIAIAPTVNGTGLNYPAGMAVDGAGDLFIADSSNNRVVELPAGGGAAIAIDPTVNGVALDYPFGVAVDGAGNLFIADQINNRVVEVPADGGAATAIDPTVNTVSLGEPRGVAVDGAGDLFIVDSDNERVVKVPADGGAATAIAPTVNSKRLNVPVGVAVDGAGDLFIADTDNDRVVKVPADGSAAIAIGPTVVGSLTLSTTFGVAVDGAGDLFIADPNNNRVVEVPAGGGAAIAIGPTVGNLTLSAPFGVALDGAGDLFIADYLNHRVVELQRSQPPTVSFPTATDDGAIDTDLPQTVQVSNSGNEPLIFSALSYPTDFPEASGDASACTGSISLSAGEECDLPIQFSPLSPANGPLSESVMLTTNASATQQSVTVTGSAIDSPSTMTAISGSTPQSATVSTAFPNALALTVKDAGGNPVSGVSVRFTAPATRASGTFSNSTGTISVNTNSNGVASAPFTANAAAGGYSVSATTSGLATVSFSLTNTPVLAISSANSTTVTVGVPVSFQVTASTVPIIANPGLTFSASGLPTGLTISSAGLISGTPASSTIGGSPYTVRITVTDAYSTTATQSFTLTVDQAPAFTTPNNTTFDVSVAGSFSITASPGYPTNAASLTVSNIQNVIPGVNLPSSGTGTINISGTPTAFGSETFTITVTNNAGLTATQHFTLSVAASMVISPDSCPTITVNTPATCTVMVTGGAPVVTLTVSNLQNAIPGVIISGSGSGSISVSGTPTAAGIETFSITATDGAGGTVKQNYTLTAQLPHYVLTTTAYPAAGGTVTPASGNLYNLGTIVPLTATTNTGYTFIGWTSSSDAVASLTSASTSITINAAESVTANFTPTLVVNTATDDAGMATNCTAQAAAGTNTVDAACSLRDALAFALNAGSGSITFDGTAFAAANSMAANTITLTSATLNIPQNTSITGPTTGSGATLTNLVTVAGGGSSSNFSVFTVSSGVTGAAIANLTITNGNAGGNGGGIVNAGTLTVTNSTISGNSGNGDNSNKNGGGIYNIGTLTVTNSTFSGNSALGSGVNNGMNGGGGGGIFNQGTLTVTNSTFTGNSAGAGGGGGIVNNGTLTVTNSTVSGNFVSGGPSGGIFNYSTLTLTNSIVDGNWEGTSSTVSQYDDLMDGSGNTVFTSGAGNNGGNLVGNYNTTTTNAPIPAIQLAPLGNYGGPTQTMLPLPGSPAICAISPSTATGTDQRGDPRTTTYGTTTCQDSGAVQTNYSIVFVQQPSTVVQNAAMLPAPTIQLDESGVAFADGTDTIAIPLSLMTGSGTLSGGSVSTSATTGVATYSALSISLPGTSDVLTANLTLNYATTPETAISIASNPFNVNSAVAQLVYNPAPATTLTAGGNAGSVTVNEENSGGTLVTTASDTVTLTVTGPGSYSNTYTVTAVNGVATFNLSSAALTTAGSYSYAASIAGNSSVTAANAPELVSAASAASVTVVSGTPQSATIGTAFAAALKVKVMDQYGNPVQGASVSFSAPSSGASATFTGSPAATVADGTASVTATANGLAGTAAYTVTASVSGAGTTASFLLTNTQASTTLTVTPSPTAIAYGQPVTISAAIAPASVLTSSPTGTITFYDGLTALTPASTVASANASYMVSVPVVGSHTYAAQYGGDTNFSQSSLTSATSSVVVGKASTTLSGPSSTVNLTYGAGGLITVSVAGQFSGAGIGAPSGSVSYTIGSGTAQSAAIVSGTATLTIPASQAAGSYTVTVSYSGDGNYNAATSIPVNLVISKATATVTLGSLSQTYTGSALSATATTTPANLTVTFTYNGLTATPTAAGNYTVIGTVNDPNYLGSAIGTLVINKATPTVAWATPAVITYGTALNATQLDASSPVAGTFAYSPAAGTVLAAGSQELSVTFTPTDATDYTAATASVTLTVNVQTQTTSLASSTLAYASGVLFGVPPLTLSATSTSGLSVTFTLLSGPATLSGNSLTVNGAGTVAIAANQAGNANYAPAPQVVENIPVNKVLPTASITSSANPALLQNAITLSATIASGAGTPTGTVTFLDGSTPLGTGTLSGGVVTLTTSSLAAGTHSITAAYGGDANFLASTSSPLAQLVEDFNFSISSTSNNSSSSITVMPGGTAVFTFTVSPVDGSIFPAAVTLTLSGLPAGATYSFSPATIAAGAGATAVTLTIDIPQTVAGAKPLTLHPGAQLAVNRNGGSSGGQAGGVAGRLAPFSLALLLLPFAGRLRRTGKRLGRMMCALLLLAAGMAAVAGMSGCGSTSGFFAQQQQSYTVTITATSGALSHSTTVTLTVE